MSSCCQLWLLSALLQAVVSGLYHCVASLAGGELSAEEGGGSLWFHPLDPLACEGDREAEKRHRVGGLHPRMLGSTPTVSASAGVCFNCAFPSFPSELSPLSLSIPDSIISGRTGTPWSSSPILSEAAEGSRLTLLGDYH